MEILTTGGIDQAIDNVAYFIAKEAILFSTADNSQEEKNQQLADMEIIWGDEIKNVTQICQIIAVSANVGVGEVLAAITIKAQFYINEHLATIFDSGTRLN